MAMGDYAGNIGLERRRRAGDYHPGLKPYVVPITVTVLVLLFLFQKRGTTRIGTVFGPIMLLWFSTIAFLGIIWIVREPRVLAAIDPTHGVEFFIRNGWRGFVVLGPFSW